MKPETVKEYFTYKNGDIYLRYDMYINKNYENSIENIINRMNKRLDNFKLEVMNPYYMDKCLRINDKNVQKMDATYVDKFKTFHELENDEDLKEFYKFQRSQIESDFLIEIIILNMILEVLEKKGIIEMDYERW